VEDPRAPLLSRRDITRALPRSQPRPRAVHAPGGVAPPAQHHLHRRGWVNAGYKRTSTRARASRAGRAAAAAAQDRSLLADMREADDEPNRRDRAGLPNLACARTKRTSALTDRRAPTSRPVDTSVAASRADTARPSPLNCSKRGGPAERACSIVRWRTSAANGFNTLFSLTSEDPGRTDVQRRRERVWPRPRCAARPGIVARGLVEPDLARMSVRDADARSRVRDPSPHSYLGTWAGAHGADFNCLWAPRNGGAIPAAQPRKPTRSGSTVDQPSAEPSSRAGVAGPPLATKGPDLPEPGRRPFTTRASQHALGCSPSARPNRASVAELNPVRQLDRAPGGREPTTNFTPPAGPGCDERE
jgi:hypothetical protein